MKNPFKVLKETMFPTKSANWADQLIDAWTYNADNMYGGKSLAFPAKKSFLVFRIIDLISKNAATIPLEYYVGNKKVIDTPYTMIFQMPNYYQTRKDLVEETAAYYALYGEAFWWLSNSVDPNELAVPDSIYVLDPRGMTAIIDTVNGKLIGWKYTTSKGKQLIFTLKEIVQFKNTNVYNRYRGLSPLDSAKIEISTHYESSQWNETHIKNGSTFSNIIQVPDRMTKPEMKKMLQEINQVHTGSKNVYKNLIIKESMKLNKASMTKLEMDFVESSKLTRDNILAAWSMPKSLLAYSEDLNRATADRYTANYWQNTVIPITEEIQDKINHFLLKLSLEKMVPRGFRIKFNYGDVEALWYNIDVKMKAAIEAMKMGSTREEAYTRFNVGIPVEDEMGKTQRNLSKLLLPYGTGDVIVSQQPTTTPSAPDEPAVVTDEFTDIHGKLIEYRDNKKNEVKSRFKLFFKKQQAKILQKINKNTLDFEIVFKQEQKRIFNQFRDEIVDIHENLNKILDFKYNSIEIDDNFIEKVTKLSTKQFINDAKDIVIESYNESKDKFEGVKKIYNTIQENLDGISKDFCDISMNLLLLKYKDFQQDVEKRYYLEEK